MANIWYAERNTVHILKYLYYFLEYEGMSNISHTYSYEIRRFTVSVIHSFFAALLRISAESSKGVFGIVKAVRRIVNPRYLRICRRASAQSELSKASAESYCVLVVVGL